jgi:hypothetical protein
MPFPGSDFILLMDRVVARDEKEPTVSNGRKINYEDIGDFQM